MPTTDPLAPPPPTEVTPSAGLAGTTPSPVGPVSTYTAAQGTSVPSTSTGYTPTPYSVPTTGLVQNQVKSIVEGDSPLLQMARQQATQEVAARGLVNSSLGIQAGQNAVIQNALPIAQADAASMKDAAFRTSDAQNQSSQFGAAASNAASSLNAQLASSMNTTNANALNTALSANAQAANVRNLTLIDTNNKQQLLTLDMQNRQLLQTNANAAAMFQDAVKNIAAISVNAELSPAAKDAAVATQMNLLRQGLLTTSTISGTLPTEIANLDLSGFFNETTFHAVP